MKTDKITCSLSQDESIKKSLEILTELANTGKLWELHNLFTQIMISYLDDQRNDCEIDSIELFQEYHFALYITAMKNDPISIEKAIRTLVEMNQFDKLKRMVYQSTIRFLNSNEKPFHAETIENYLLFLEVLN